MSRTRRRLYTLERIIGRPCVLHEQRPQSAIDEARRWVRSAESGWERRLVELDELGLPRSLVGLRPASACRLILEHGRALTPWLRCGVRTGPRTSTMAAVALAERVF